MRLVEKKMRKERKKKLRVMRWGRSLYRTVLSTGTDTPFSTGRSDWVLNACVFSTDGWVPGERPVLTRGSYSVLVWIFLAVYLKLDQLCIGSNSILLP